MRKVSTQTISISAAYEPAFEYLSNPLKQKEWAVNFMKDVTETAGGFRALTPFGEMPLEFRCDREYGVINIILGGGEAIPTRLIKNEEGCVYQFTLFQPIEMPDHVWEEQGIKGLQEELVVLKSILENQLR